MKTSTTTTLLLPLLTACAAPAAAAPLPLQPRLSLNTVLALLSELVPTSTALAASADVIEAADTLLADALGYRTTTYNALLSSGSGCGDVTLIFARGTDEPGNVGALVGPEFYAALQTAVGGKTVALQGVNNYEASVTEYLEGGSTTGASDMASLVKQAFAQCPDTQVVMSGYSQGAQVVHLAAADLAAATMEKVSAVVTFGDPDSDSAVANIDASKVDVICHAGDDICDFGDLILLPHLTYAEDVAAAAAFVVALL